MIDVEQKKNKIISYIEMNGPSLPVRIAKAIEMEPVFASAILSELVNSKQIKMSNIKIGASSLYLLSGQEQKLEGYTENLKSIENDAYIKLRERKILEDEKEPPAIRVALRNIKDFATPFRFNEKIMWKYAFTPDEEIENILTPKKEEPKIDKIEEEKETPEAPKAWEAKKEEIKEAKEESKKIENIFISKKESTKKPGDETFLERIKEFLEKQGTKITSIKEVDKKKLIAEVESDSETTLLFAFNKTRINEPELMQCYKQSKAANLPYQLIVLGDLTKKMNHTIEAYQNLTKVSKLEP